MLIYTTKGMPIMKMKRMRYYRKLWRRGNSNTVTLPANFLKEAGLEDALYVMVTLDGNKRIIIEATGE